jgi:DNA-directed RNA polymerase specialized sigma24 family protein
MKYTEIAELIDRDQRNVWTIYSRAMKKLKNKNI